jgi:hypothetical protein
MWPMRPNTGDALRSANTKATEVVVRFDRVRERDTLVGLLEDA